MIVGLNFAIKINVIVGFNISRSPKVGIYHCWQHYFRELSHAYTILLSDILVHVSLMQTYNYALGGLNY